jgi:hypothetical protein
MRGRAADFPLVRSGEERESDTNLNWRDKRNSAQPPTLHEREPLKELKRCPGDTCGKLLPTSHFD